MYSFNQYLLHTYLFAWFKLILGIQDWMIRYGFQFYLSVTVIGLSSVDFLQMHALKVLHFDEVQCVTFSFITQAFGDKSKISLPSP